MLPLATQDFKWVLGIYERAGVPTDKEVLHALGGTLCRSLSDQRVGIHWSYTATVGASLNTTGGFIQRFGV